MKSRYGDDLGIHHPHPAHLFSGLVGLPLSRRDAIRNAILGGAGLMMAGKAGLAAPAAAGGLLGRRRFLLRR